MASGFQKRKAQNKYLLDIPLTGEYTCFGWGVAMASWTPPGRRHDIDAHRAIGDSKRAGMTFGETITKLA